MQQIFLGGTCGSNHWREEIVIPRLIERGVPAECLFNPVVPHWTPEAQANEDRMKQTAYQVYVIASPDPSTPDVATVSGYSLVELTMALYDAPERTAVCFVTDGMARRTAKGIMKAAQDLRERFPYAPIFSTYDELVDWLVEHYQGASV